MKDNISIDTFKLIVKMGIIIGQANPNKDVDTLVKGLVEIGNKRYKDCRFYKGTKGKG